MNANDLDPMPCGDRPRLRDLIIVDAMLAAGASRVGFCIRADPSPGLIRIEHLVPRALLSKWI
jgi:hypothetical protein